MTVKRNKLLVIGLLLLVTVLALPAVVTGQNVLEVNGKAVDFDVAPRMDDSNRLWVPIRFVAEFLGYSVNWNPDKEEVVLTGNGAEIIISVGKSIVKTPSGDKTIAAPKVIQGRTMVTADFTSEILGASVKWGDKGAAPVVAGPEIKASFPPAVPHEVNSRKDLCLSCHNSGIINIPQTTHPERSNCVQCHVPSQQEVW